MTCESVCNVFNVLASFGALRGVTYAVAYSATRLNTAWRKALGGGTLRHGSRTKHFQFLHITRDAAQRRIEQDRFSFAVRTDLVS